MTLDKYNTAVRMRGIIEKLAIRVVERERPSDKIGRVVDIDRGNATAWVVYPGDEETSLKVRMYPGRQPQASDRVTGSGLGAIVRVSGPIGSRYITEVLSDAGHYDRPRFFQPRIASAGTMENTLQTWFAVRTTGVPPRDNATRYYTAVINLPLAAGMIDVQTEVVLDTGLAYQQFEQFKFDNSTAKNVDTACTVVSTTSSTMGLTSYFNLYDGALDGMAAGSIGVNLMQTLNTTGTLVPVRSNILIKVFGMNPELLRMVDSTSLS